MGTDQLLDAVHRNNLELVELLISNGADVNFNGGYERSPLLIAAKLGYYEIAEILISKGADVNIKVVTYYSAEDAPLNIAAEHSNLEIVKLLVSKGADVNLITHHHGTPIHNAVKGGNIEILRYIISKGGDINKKIGIDNQTPLDIAVNLGNYEFVKLLILNGADVNTKYSGSALHWALKKGYHAIAELLIYNGADIYLKDNNDEETPLHLAAKVGNIDLVKLLISKGVDIHAQDKNGSTPLSNAAFGGNREIVELLISRGADINANTGSALRNAVYEGFPKIVEFLLSKGAEVNLMDEDDKSYLIIALEIGRDKIFRSAIAADIDDETLVKALSEESWEGNSSAYMGIYKSYFEIVDLLISNGADINRKDKFGKYPLKEAIYKGFYKIAELLISKGADVNLILFDLVSSKNLERVKFLISNGADVNVKDKNGATPLHYTKEKEMADLLINNGADMNILDNEGRIADIAYEYGDYQALEGAFKNFIKVRGSLYPQFSSGFVEFDKLVNTYFQKLKDCLYETTTSVSSGGKYPDYRYSHSFDAAIKSIEELSKIMTPISSNLLYLLTEIHDIEVTLNWSSCGPGSGTKGLLSFTPIREKAFFELQKIGNPVYNSKAFSDTEAYILHAIDRKDVKNILLTENREI